MADIKTFQTRVLNKVDTDANWTKNDPILKVGEIAISSDYTPYRVKIGTGGKWSETPWDVSSEATTSTSGLLSAADKKKIDLALTYSALPNYTVGTSTIGELKAALLAWAKEHGNHPKATCYFKISNSLLSSDWANDDTVTTNGITYTVTMLNSYGSNNNHFTLLLSPHSASNTLYIVSIESGVVKDTLTALITSRNISAQSVASAAKLTTARTIGLSGAAVGTATSFNGTSNISIPVTSLNESYLEWGTNSGSPQSYNGCLSYAGATFNPQTRSNLIAGLGASHFTFERSTDAGSTWTTYTPSNLGSYPLITYLGNSYTEINNGNTTTSQSVKNWHRITINFTNAVYGTVNKILMEISTSGAKGCKVKIEELPYGDGATWSEVGTYSISGWSGWNEINLAGSIKIGGNGGTDTSKREKMRFTFSQTGVDSSHLSYLALLRLFLVGPNHWSAPSTLAMTDGSPFSYSNTDLSAVSNVNISAPLFKGNLSGNATSATKATQDSSGQTINTTYIKSLSASGTTITYTKGDGTTGTISTQDKNTTYGIATASTAGLVKPISVISATVNSASTTSGRYYPVQMNTSGNMFVNVPWTDTNTVYTHPSHSAVTGKPTASASPSFGGTVIVSQITSDSLGHVTGATDRTITIPSTLSNGSGTAGLIKTSSTVTSSSGYTACPVISGVPYYKDTNTTYSAATSSAAGLMSASDKAKLDGIASGANNYTYTLPTATSSVLGGVKVGSNITVSSGTISLTKANVTAALGYTPPTTNTTYSAATTDTAGLMSAADKVKLNGIATGANAYSLPTASSSTLGGVKTTSTVTSTSGLTACPIISGVPYYQNTNTNTSHSHTAGTGLTISGTGGTSGTTTYSANLNSTASLGTIGTTSKLYAVGVDANGKLCVNVPWTDTNTTYTFTANNPTLAWGTTSTIGTVGGTTLKVTMPSNPNTDTHYTTGIVAGGTGATANASATNPYIAIKDNSTYRSQVRLVGSGATTISSDANGNITIKTPTVSGPTGPQGIQGPTGPQGPTGSSDTYTIVNGTSSTDTTGYTSTSGYSSTPYLNLVKNGSTVVKSLKLSGSNGTIVYAVNGGFSFTSSSSSVSVTNKAATLSYGSTSTIATINNTDITVKMPSASGNTYSYHHSGTMSSQTATVTLSSESSSSLSNLWVLVSGEVWTTSSANDNQRISALIYTGALDKPYMTQKSGVTITGSLSGTTLSLTCSTSWQNVKVKTIY